MWSGGVPRSALASVPVLVLASVLVSGNYFCWKFDFGIRFFVIVVQAVSCYQCLLSVRVWG